MIWELLKAYFVVVVIFTLVLCVVYWIFSRVVSAGTNQDPDTHTTHHGGNYSYVFTDPYGNHVFRSRFRTEEEACRAAELHRDRIAKELEEAMGL